MKPRLSKTDQAKACQQMRTKVIALLMGWKPEHFGTWDTAKMRHVPDMTKIYSWINEYGHRKPKWFNKYTYDELVTLVSQIEKITRTHGQPKQDQKPKSRDP